LSKNKEQQLLSLAANAKINCTILGTVTSGEIHVNNEDWGNISTWKNKYDTAIENIMNNK
jgi:hypothetical protein